MNSNFQIEKLMLEHEWLVKRVARRAIAKYAPPAFMSIEDVESEIRCEMLVVAAEYCRTNHELSFRRYASPACLCYAFKYLKRMSRLPQFTSRGLGKVRASQAAIDDVLDSQCFIVKAAKHLRERQFTVVLRRLGYGEKLRELAHQLRITKPRVSNILETAIEKLQKKFVQTDSE